jgi:hypothetical protein
MKIDKDSGLWKREWQDAIINSITGMFNPRYDTKNIEEKLRDSKHNENIGGTLISQSLSMTNPVHYFKPAFRSKIAGTVVGSVIAILNGDDVRSTVDTISLAYIGLDYSQYILRHGAVMIQTARERRNKTPAMLPR